MSKNKQKIINEAPKIKPLGDNKIAESRGNYFCLFLIIKTIFLFLISLKNNILISFSYNLYLRFLGIN
jgi:hypothetical protein